MPAFSNRNGIMVVAILRAHAEAGEQPLRINAPAAATPLYPGDTLEIIGDDSSIESFIERSRTEVLAPASQTQGSEGEMLLQRLIVGSESPLVARTLAESGLHRQYHCMLVGTEDSDGHIVREGAGYLIRRGDVLWVVGEKANIAALTQVVRGKK